MKSSIDQLKQDVADAKSRHAEASKDLKRIEKDLKDFEGNKDNKLAELQKSIDTLKKAQLKNSVSVKSLQKEFQSARLEVEQGGADQATVQEQLDEVDATLQAQEAEMKALQVEQAQVKVSLWNVSSRVQISNSYYRTHMTSPKPASTTNVLSSPASMRSSEPSKMLRESKHLASPKKASSSRS